MSPTIKYLAGRPLIGYLAAIAGVVITTLILLVIQRSVMDITKEYVRPYSIGYLLPVALVAAIWGWRQGAAALLLSLLAANFVLMLPRLKLHTLLLTNIAAGDLIALFLVGLVLVVALEQVQSSAATSERLLERSIGQLAQQQYVLDSLPDGVIIADLTGAILIMNPAAVAMHGYNSANLADIPDSLKALDTSVEFYDPDWKRIAAEDSPFARAGRSETFEAYKVHAQRPDTGRFWDASYAATPIKDQDGEPVLHMVTMRDITDTSFMESALRISEDRLKLALEAAQVGTWQWDIAGDTILWSGRSESILGIADGVTNTLEAFLATMAGPDRAPAEAAIRKAIAEHSPCVFEFGFTRTDGVARRIASRASAYYDSSGEATRLEGVVVDVTERAPAVDLAATAAKK